MKKQNKNMLRITAIAFAATTTFSIVGCTGSIGGIQGGDGEEIDKNRKQIYVSAYNGGYGLDWVYSVKKDFEADHPEYQVLIVSQKNDPIVTSQMIQSGTSDYHVYIQCGSAYMKELVVQDCLADLSDIFEEKASESETMTIEKKIIDSERQKAVYSKRDGTGIYAFPYAWGCTGIVFDFNLFLENNWLEYAALAEQTAVEAQGIVCHAENGKLIFDESTGKVNYKKGDKILTTGRDGKYGTYDDGQPTTLEAFEFMLAKINASGRYSPFIYSSNHPEYLDSITSSIFATYEGAENFELFYSFDGTYSRTNTVITPETGYDVYTMEGLRVGAQFMHDYLTRSDSYASGVAKGYTFTEAQNQYLLGYKNESGTQGAMLVEGFWWENEAKGTFNAIGKQDASRGFGKREYRYLIYPEFEGQYGIDGTGKGTIFTPLEEGIIAVDKNTPADVMDAAKEFVKYTCRDKYLIEAAKVGCYRPYKFIMDENEASVTPFIRNLFEMLSDEENVKILPIALMQDRYDLSYYGLTASTFRYNPFVFTNFFNDKGKTVDEYLSAAYSAYRKNWNSYIEKMNMTLK